jgi:hypothetical protein
MSQALVAIVMGSDSDLEIMREAGKALDEFGIAYEMDVTSAHRSPDRTADFARKAAERGICVIIAGAGGAAHLAGGDCGAYYFAGDRGADSLDFFAGDGFSAGDRADAGGDSGGDRRDWEAGSYECGDPGGADDCFAGRYCGEETRGAQGETGSRRGGEVEEAEEFARWMTRCLRG